MVRTTLSFHSISYAVDLPGRKEHGKFGLQERRRAVACCMHARMHARTHTDAHSTQLWMLPLVSVALGICVALVWGLRSC